MLQTDQLFAIGHKLILSTSNKTKTQEYGAAQLLQGNRIQIIQASIYM